MTGRFILSFVLIFTFSGTGFSQTTNITINGSNPEYAGTELEFFYYKERIFYSYETLAKTSVDSAGFFSVSFSLDKTQCVYCQTPLYTGFVFTEPGNSYHLELPPIPASALEISKNPFFIPPLWHMVPAVGSNDGSRELNAEINDFNKQFEPFLDKQILRYYNTELSREKLDSFVQANNSAAMNRNHEYYKSYCLYKYATLDFTVSQFNHSILYEKYLREKPARPDVPSWWEFFNLFFDRYFSSLAAKNEYSQLYSITGKGDYYSLTELLRKDPALQNDQIREWVILKEIRNAFYENGLPLKAVFTICDSLSAQTSDQLSISISEILIKEVSSLLPGNSPPHATIINSDGDTLDVAAVSGKYNYIGFCSLDNLECLQEFEYLKYYYHKHSKYLDIIIILPESEKDRIELFTSENSIPWKFWYGIDNSKIHKDYKVRSYPVFYLLDREGKLVMSPAILPSRGFEQHLFTILKGRKEI